MNRDHSEESKHGVRILNAGGGKLTIKQTILKGNRHVFDTLPDGRHWGVFVDSTDDAAVAKAVRLAMDGKLRRSLKGA